MPIVLEALPPLFILAILIVAIALTVGVKLFVSALFLAPNAVAGYIPWIGGKVKHASVTMEKKINDQLGSVVNNLQGAVTLTWHALAYLIELTGEAIWEATQLGAHVMWLVRVKYPLDVISFLAHEGAAAARFAGRVRTGDIKNYYTQKGISAKQWRELFKKVTTLGLVVAALRAAQAHAPALPRVYVPSLPISLKGIRGRLGKLEHRFGRTAFAAAVATALAALGVSWARKSCAKRTADGFCRVDPDVFAGLIAGLAVVGGAQSVVRFANGMLAVEDEMVGVLERLIVELGDTAG